MLQNHDDKAALLAETAATLANQLLTWRTVCQASANPVFEAYLFPWLLLPVIGRGIIHYPFNTVLVSKTTKIRTPGTITDRPFYLSSY